MVNINTQKDDQRITRGSRSNSASESNDCHVLTFDKPITIENPGTYRLNSDCSIYLFNSIFSSKHNQQLQSYIDSLPTLKQHEAIHKNSARLLPRLLPRLSAWYGPIDYE